MSVVEHVAELQKKHAELSLKVEREQKSLGTDDFAIVAMKKQKLRLKEEIQRLSAQVERTQAAAGCDNLILVTSLEISSK